MWGSGSAGLWECLLLASYVQCTHRYTSKYYKETFSAQCFLSNQKANQAVLLLEFLLIQGTHISIFFQSPSRKWAVSSLQLQNNKYLCPIRLKYMGPAFFSSNGYAFWGWVELSHACQL